MPGPTQTGQIRAPGNQRQAEYRQPQSQTFFGALGEHWRNAADPEIAIVAQQTRDPSPMPPDMPPAEANGKDEAGDKPADEKKPAAEEEEKEKEKKWYDKIGFRGYAQFRINETILEEDGSAPAHHAGDRSVGEDQSFLIRRARIILSGDVSDHMFIYLQPDFASNVPGSPDANHFAQIRDWYADCYVDDCKVYRFRVGQSKVPYGWQNLQSSSNRLPMDRDDSLNRRYPQQAQPRSLLLLHTGVRPELLQGRDGPGPEGVGQLRRVRDWRSTTAKAVRCPSRTTTCISSRDSRCQCKLTGANTGKWACKATPECIRCCRRKSGHRRRASDSSARYFGNGK